MRQYRSYKDRHKCKANLIQILVNAKCNSCGCKFILGYETDDYFKVREIK